MTHLLRILAFTFLIVLTVPAHCQLHFKLPELEDTSSLKKGIARTAWLLTSGTKHQPKEVRVLVYGQSISVQVWWQEVKNFMVNEYPLAQIKFINKAIGGFSTERLKLMVANDVVAFYPDLILFHDYGNEADYEFIIETIRKITTAEIAIQTDHMAMQNQEWHDMHNGVWLPALCRKYELALIDVRTTWKAYLKENKLLIKDLLTDGVHLNAQGNHLMAAIINNYLKDLPAATFSDNPVRTFKAGKDFTVKNARLSIPVTGNRIDIVWKQNHIDHSKPIQVRIDNSKPSSCACCFYYTRPAWDTTGFMLKYIGQLLAMQLTDKVVEENWALTIIATDSIRQQIQFSLRGSVTGDDGTGNSDVAFTSRSGKISIQPEYWFLRKTANDFAQFNWLQPGAVLTWQVKSLCYDMVKPQSSSTTTIAQGLPNGKHLLELSGEALHHVKEIRVYQPPIK